ncbi:MAG: hypothetical protein PHQ54_04280, partial [Candidatus Omnitrophica bacterium]|nr:hypothetical protein [Candidatus Omnitrophota bacterium]
LFNTLYNGGPKGLACFISMIKGEKYLKNLMINIHSNDTCHVCYRLLSSPEVIRLINKMRA